MADARHIIPFIFYWEDGVPAKYLDRPFPELFGKAKERGLVIIEDDAGGATVCGVTYDTYRTYKRKKGLPEPTVEELVTMSPDEWLDVFKTLFWNRICGEGIVNQAVADMIVDWAWTSGVPYVAKRVQKVVGAKRDGIIGPKTLALINGRNSACLLEGLRLERIDYYEAIVRAKPKNRKFLQGWINRTNSCAKWK